MLLKPTNAHKCMKVYYTHCTPPIFLNLMFYIYALVPFNFCSISMYLFFITHLPEDGHISARNTRELYSVYNTLLYTYVHLLVLIWYFFFTWWRAPQQMLRTHHSLKTFCATLWWRWAVFLPGFRSNGTPMEWNWQGKTDNLEKTLS
jgi:hypothetical protein